MDFEQDHVEQLTAHYSPISASLLFGAVHRVRWTLSQAIEARNQWSDDGNHTVAWITAPARPGGECAARAVAPAGWLVSGVAEGTPAAARRLG